MREYIDIINHCIHKLKPLIEGKTGIDLEEIVAKPSYEYPELDKHPELGDTAMFVDAFNYPDSIFVFRDNPTQKNKNTVRPILIEVVHELAHHIHKYLILNEFDKMRADNKSVPYKKEMSKRYALLPFKEGFAEYMSLDYLTDAYKSFIEYMVQNLKESKSYKIRKDFAVEHKRKIDCLYKKRLRDIRKHLTIDDEDLFCKAMDGLYNQVKKDVAKELEPNNPFNACQDDAGTSQKAAYKFFTEELDAVAPLEEVPSIVFGNSLTDKDPDAHLNRLLKRHLNMYESIPLSIKEKKMYCDCKKHAESEHSRGYKFFKKVLDIIGEDKILEVAITPPKSEREIDMPFLYLLRNYPAKAIVNIPKYLSNNIRTHRLKKDYCGENAKILEEWNSKILDEQKARTNNYEVQK